MHTDGLTWARPDSFDGFFGTVTCAVLCRMAPSAEAPYAGVVKFGVIAIFTICQLAYMLGVWGITWAGVRTALRKLRCLPEQCLPQALCMTATLIAYVPWQPAIGKSVGKERVHDRVNGWGLCLWVASYQ